MKILLLTTFVATVCCVNGGTLKTLRLLAALNGGVLPGVNGGVLPGVNGGMANGGAMAGMNGGMANGAVPVVIARGLNPPVVAGGGAGIFGQPQFAQFVPAYPAFPVPNVYPVPVVNPGVPQLAPMNAPQQPLVGANGAMQQQPPVQPDLARRFRRQIMKQDNTIKTTADTQIPAPTETVTTTCNQQNN